jgi:hypothetical protein
MPRALHSSTAPWNPWIGSVSPNKSLQRAVFHKVLGHGRGRVTLTSSFPRPRADKSARGR